MKKIKVTKDLLEFLEEAIWPQSYWRNSLESLNAALAIRNKALTCKEGDDLVISDHEHEKLSSRISCPDINLMPPSLVAKSWSAAHAVFTATSDSL